MCELKSSYFSKNLITKSARRVLSGTLDLRRAFDSVELLKKSRVHVGQYQNMTSLYSDLNVRKLESRATTLSLLQALAEGKL